MDGSSDGVGGGAPVGAAGVPLPAVPRLMTPEEFLVRTGEEVARARRHARPLAVATVLLDGMTMIRKADGRPVADAVFDRVAATVIAALRGSDRTGRLGSAHLGVLLPETGAAEAVVAAGRLCRQVRGWTVPTAAGPRHVTLSIGVAALTADAPDPRILLLAACDELRRAQLAGGDRVCSPAACCAGPRLVN